MKKRSHTPEYMDSYSQRSRSPALIEKEHYRMKAKDMENMERMSRSRQRESDQKYRDNKHSGRRTSR